MLALMTRSTAWQPAFWLATPNPRSRDSMSSNGQNSQGNNFPRRVIVTEASVKHLKVKIASATLSNGLRVVVAPDSTAPVVTVGIYYKIGFRLEPHGRSGFAHLFEHMMFQGSENAGKMEHIRLINSSGGMLNGTTNYDVTNYFESVPSNALERVLWLEADRMRALKVD